MMRGDETAHAAGAPSTPARSGAVDRLAQLARLIEQDKTLAAIVRDGRSEGGLDLSLPAEQPPLFLRDRKDTAFAPDREDEAALVDRSWCDEPAGEPPEPPKYGAYEGPDYSNGLPDGRRGLKVFAALTGLALAGSASAVTYWALSDGRGRSDEARVVAASVSPDKTEPSPREPSGSDERPHAQADEQTVNATAGTTTVAQEPADPKPPIPQVLPLTGFAIGAGPTKMAGLIPGPTPPEDPADTAQNPPADVKKVWPRRTAPGATEPGGAQRLRYVVQLSSERGEAAAHANSQVLQTKYRNEFAGRKPFICRAELGDRGVYYRVQMGPFAMREANEICGNLKKSGADCVVKRN